MVRSMMTFAELPKSFWGYALETAVYTLNRVPSKSVDTTPYEIWSKKKPSLSHMKVWGCPAYVKRTVSDKLDAKFDKFLFVGYPKETMGYYFYNPLEQKVFVSKHAVFLEKEFLLKGESGSKIELDEVQDQQQDVNQPIDPMPITHDDEVIIEPKTTQGPRRTSRAYGPPERYGFLVSNEDNEPTTYEEVLKSSEIDKWLKAMKSEMDSMYQNQVWTLVDPLEEIKPIG